MQLLVEKGLLASDWVKAISPLIGGKGGGSKSSAQASGTNINQVSGVLEKARNFAAKM
jgi:alanyl-tRNA synthetase